MAKSVEEKAKEAAEKKIAQDKKAAEDAIAAGAVEPSDELTDEEIAAKSAEIAAKKKADDDARDAARNNPTTGEKMYSETVVRQMLKQLSKDLAEKKDVDEEDEFKNKKVRLPRFKEKFIVGLKNMNTDEFFPDLVIQAFDIWDDKIRQNVAYVCLQFLDGSELNVPLYTALTKSAKVICDLVEIKEDDTSYSDGKTERAETRDYSRVGTGTMVKLKVKQANYTYVVKLPDGTEVTVGPEVLNW